MNEIPRKTRLAVIARDRDKCLACGAKGTEIQHRVRRREGGHAMGNLMRVDATCHRRIHSNPAWAVAKGYTVSAVQNLDPALIPLWTFNGWTLLHNDGTTTVIAPAAVKPEDLEAYLEALLEVA